MNADARPGMHSAAAHPGESTAPDDQRFMAEALELAAQAAAAGEVPVGAVVVRQGQVVGRGHNAPISRNDPSAHAEVMALRDAATRLGNYRLGDCTLYTTLEPCAMCAGAIQHARIRRLVFGAQDAKAGAVGSVVDLFANPRLNQHAQVLGGVRAEEGARLLSDFFTERRLRAPPAWPLREDALRTPDERFADLPDFSWSVHHFNDLPGLDGLRMAYVDEGPKDAPRSWLCLHGHLTWSYGLRHLMAAWLAQGDRVVAPDWVGFGRSDKPKREQWHQPEQHRQILLGFVDRLALSRVIWVVQDSAALVVQDLPAAASGSHLGWALLSTPTAASASRPPGNPLEDSAMQAPFPDAGHQAGQRAWAQWSSSHLPPSGPQNHRHPQPRVFNPTAPTPDSVLALQMWQALAAPLSMKAATVRP